VGGGRNFILEEPEEWDKTLEEIEKVGK